METQEIISAESLTETITTSGQPTRAQFDAIREAGYSVVINLAMADSDNAIPDEGSLVASLGMTYIHLPVPFESPTAGHVLRFITLVSALAGEKIWIHCVVNYRASVFLYHFLTKASGFRKESSKTAILRQWEPTMTEVWRRILDLTAEEIGYVRPAVTQSYGRALPSKR